MRAAFRLLTILCFAWCALGIAEPAAAHGEGVTAHAHSQSAPDSDDDSDSTGQVALDGHHHCPLAYDLTTGAIAMPASKPGAQIMKSKVVSLASLTHAPPLQPPSA